MLHFVYLISLLLTIGCLLVIDFRYKLAFWNQVQKTVITLGVSLCFFILWDILGILLNVFSHGLSRISLTFTLFPQFPIEELFFLIVLLYSSLLLYRGVIRLCSPTAS